MALVLLARSQECTEHPLVSIGTWSLQLANGLTIPLKKSVHRGEVCRLPSQLSLGKWLVVSLASPT